MNNPLDLFADRSVDCNPRPLSVEGLIEALAELKRQCDENATPIMLHAPMYLRPPTMSEREFTAQLFAVMTETKQ